MEVQRFKKRFVQDLTGSYPQEEIQSFFTLLCEHYLGKSRLEIALSPHLAMSPAQSTQFQDALQGLLQQQPIQYILGETQFNGLRFTLNSHTLIPRPETEELVAWIVEDYEQTANDEAIQLLDIGTGSGCIAISLAVALPFATVAGLDISEQALSCARENARLNQVTVGFNQQDILQTDQLAQSYDVIVSNPPYVRASEKAHMKANVLDFEPATALYVSDDQPLVFYKKIATLAREFLHPDGSLYLEINEYLSEELKEVLHQFGFESVELRKDLFGKDRMIKARLM